MACIVSVLDDIGVSGTCTVGPFIVLLQSFSGNAREKVGRICHKYTLPAMPIPFYGLSCFPIKFSKTSSWKTEQKSSDGEEGIARRGRLGRVSRHLNCTPSTYDSICHCTVLASATARCLSCPVHALRHWLAGSAQHHARCCAAEAAAIAMGMLEQQGTHAHDTCHQQ